jgi:hypothetical protein
LQQISMTAKAALTQIAQEQDGVILADAHHLVASAIHRPLDECSTALIELTASDLVVRNAVGRLEANFDKLGLAEVKGEIQAKDPAYEIVGPPHSATAMTTLHELFATQELPIYLCTEVTHPSVFTQLRDRAALNRRTIFIIQGRHHLRDDRKPHFDEVLQEWKKLMKSSPQIKSSTEIRVAKQSNAPLYTSALAKNYVRFDMYNYDMDSTRDGVVIRADSGSSFYDLVRQSYEQAHIEAAPLFSLWPKQWLAFQTGKYWIPMVAFVLVFAIIRLFHWSAPAALGSLAISFVARSAHEWWGNFRSRSRTLF